MPSFRLLLIIVALTFCLNAATASPAPRYPAARRQDGNEPTSTASRPIETSQPPSTSREPSVAQSASEPQSTTAESASRSSVVVTSSAVSTTPGATASGSAATSGTDPGAVSADPLPLHPKITPALGLIGTLLLISGTAYALVGIRNKWIYVFGSAAYLSALAVTVLIVYLMSPPVSNAIQGAFFVAAFFTGVFFGVGALVFSDLTEGLGCLLGGYCLSMWFLSLKEGGLITSTAGRAIFIGCMSVAGYCLSFSPYTRTYGLIGSISFSGATIAMLGVDCFSRAGWKEFWLYLWNLNPDTFPLNTRTYPLTRGIKVELAGVVILCVFGVVSQLRLWKLVKERRDVREQYKQQNAESQMREEAELGRQIEDKFEQERRQWEATYGEKGPQASGEESGVTTPQSPSLYGKEDSVIDMSKNESPTYTNKQAVVAISPVQEDEIQRIDSNGTPLTQDSIVNQPADVSKATSSRPSSEAVPASHLSRSVSTTSSLKPSSLPPPVVVPLPFRIPQEEDTKSEHSDNASVSAIPDVEDEVPVLDPVSLPRSFSGQHTMQRLSTGRSSVDGCKVEDVVMMTQSDNDRASSIAATLDEEDRVSLQELSPPHSPIDVKCDLEDSTKKDSDENETAATLSKDGNNEERAVASVGEATTATGTPKIVVQTAQQFQNESHDHLSPRSLSQSSPRQSLTLSTDPKPDDASSKRGSAQSQRLRHDTLVNSGSDKSQATQFKSDALSPESQGDTAGSAVDNFSTALPARLSKVAQSYRTNEWAKHLESAEKPAVEEINEPDSPGAQLVHERLAPVNEGIEQPFVAAKRTSNRISSDNDVHRKKALMQINSNSTMQSHGDIQSLARQDSQIKERGARIPRTQTPLVPLVMKPVGRRISSSPAQAPNKTLMGKRESLMRNRVSAQNFNQQISSTNDLTAADDEDMTLAQRKRALKNQMPPSASQKWQKNSWIAGAQVEGFDSHQPKRTVGSGSHQKREELLADWRGSLQKAGTPTQSAATREEQQRAAMMNAKRQREMEKQQQTAMAQHRESMRHNMMRSSEMLDAHREAMRRMQAAANKHA